jgi:multicomponent Na+:H+ antiporter subunit F
MGVDTMTYFLWVALFILVSIALGLVRVMRGPTQADRMLTAQLFGTGGVAVLLILAQAMRLPSLVDVALVYALLAAITMVVFVKRQWAAGEPEEEDPNELD